MTIDGKPMAQEQEEQLAAMMHGKGDYEAPEDVRMRGNIRQQLEKPDRRNIDHIKKSLIWTTTQNIKKIQAQLVEGYSFDKDNLNDLVAAMFGFIQGCVRPQEEGTDIVAEIVDEEIVK